MKLRLGPSHRVTSVRGAVKLNHSISQAAIGRAWAIAHRKYLPNLLWYTGYRFYSRSFIWSPATVPKVQKTFFGSWLEIGKLVWYWGLPFWIVVGHPSQVWEKIESTFWFLNGREGDSVLQATAPMYHFLHIWNKLNMFALTAVWIGRTASIWGQQFGRCHISWNNVPSHNLLLPPSNHMVEL